MSLQYAHSLAYKASEEGLFANEIIPIEGHNDKGFLVNCDKDEVIRAETTVDALSQLPAVFDPKNGSITAGNSSAISDGASAVIVMSEKRAKDLGLQILARIKSMASVGVDPAVMGYGPVPAVKKALKRASMEISDVDVFELNEALQLSLFQS